MGVVISYLIKDAMETTIATDVSALKGKVDDVVQVRGGTPILAHTPLLAKRCVSNPQTVSTATLRNALM